MNKGQGTTLGGAAILLAALFFRTGGAEPPTVQRSNDSSIPVQEALGQRSTGEGPWMASCDYWAPDRDASDHTSKPPAIHVSLDEHGRHVKGTLTGLDETERECDGSDDEWGLPSTSDLPDQHSPQQANQHGASPTNAYTITTIIATVPDPIRTDMPFLFDREIDAIIEAASDHGYEASYSWMPWQLPGARITASKEDTGKNDQEKKEHEPGLLIFRPETKPAAKAQEWRSALYVFLVGETPTEGINGFQMAKAFQYEEHLKAKPPRNHSDTGTDLAIIGPTFSGSAASLRRAIEHEVSKNGEQNVTVRGATSTPFAAHQLDNRALPATSHQPPCTDHSIGRSGNTRVQYQSFFGNSTYNERCLISLIEDSRVDDTRIAVLSEDGTTLGQQLSQDEGEHLSTIGIRFPRGISRLRNAHNDAQGIDRTGESSTPPSPYLHLSLKGANAFDDVPDFDSDTTPLSQEAQLMSIQRELRRDRTEYILIGGTSILDKLFLAQNLHRAVPDARLVFDDSDLLLERDIEDQPYIGSIAVGPYPLMRLENPRHPGYGGRAFPDDDTEAYYNAATDFLCRPNCSAGQYASDNLTPGLNPIRPPLWLTVIGRDGYYPLGIASKSPSDDNAILPIVFSSRPDNSLPFYPSHTWDLLCTFVMFLCLSHTAMLLVANYWSPFTHSLAIDGRDDPSRLCMYINIGTVMLVSMAFVTVWPLFACKKLIYLHTSSVITGLATLAAGIIALIVTFGKTRHYLRPIVQQENRNSRLSEDSLIPLFNLIALLTLVAIPLFWYTLCNRDTFVRPGSGAALFFAYRCLNPQSGVSPLNPLLLLLSSWYVWAIFHTFRLRFSHNDRPLLPSRIKSAELEADARPSYALYVADEDMKGQDNANFGCLYSNMTCLLITREVFLRSALTTMRKRWNGQGCPPCACIVHWMLAILYLLAFIVALLLPYMHSVERILWRTGFWPTPYEFLLRALFFPLLLISFTTWLRMILVWGALKRDLLQRLEGVPLRFAFDRLKGGGWTSMFRQSGLREQWRDMARSTESARQLLNDPGFKAECVGDKTSAYPALSATYNRLNTHITALLDHLGGSVDSKGDDERSSRGQPAGKCANESHFMHVIEEDYQNFSTDLLRYLLIPYWWKTRHGLVESRTEGANVYGALRASMDKKETPDAVSSDDREASWTDAAEEFIALRYIALIRAVLVNVRFLMIFVVISFVLAIVAWNSYPFQPRQTINWVFTFLLGFLGTGIVWVLAQMHRDPILSRITDKRPNELGWGFFIKVFSLGAVPFLTWLAYNYPEIGSTLCKLVQPGANLVK